MIVDELGRIPMSPNLATALQRASDYAAAQSHVEVTLEHLLLALTQDADAGQVLEASHVDIARLEADVSTHLGRIDDRYPPGQPVQLTVSAELKRILEASAAAAAKGRRREINGAIVLAAIVGDARTVAAHMLRAQGLTFEEAIRVLRAPPAPPRHPPPVQPQFEPASHQPPQPVSRPAPPPQVQREDANAEDILAGARERVQTRARPLVMPADEPQRPSQRTVPAAQPHPVDPLPQPEPEYVPDPELPSGYEDHDPPQPAYEPPPQRPDYEPRFETLPQASWPAAGEDRGEPPGRREPPPAFEPQPTPHIPAEPRWAPPPLPQPPPVAQPAPATLPPPGARGGPIGGPMPPAPHGPAAHNTPLHPPYMPPPASQHRPPPPPMERPLDGPFPPRPMTPGATSPSAPAPPAQVPHRLPPQVPAHAPAPPQRPDPPAYAPWPEHPADPRQPPSQPPPMAAEASRERNPTHPPADRRRTPPSAVEAGQLVENIPRRMRVAVPVVVETRIAKASVKALAEGMRGGGPASHHDVAVTKAMSVKLRAPEGGFWIETASPETQWIENVSGLMSDDYASWRWTVTPRTSGRKRLQLVVSARTVATDGLTAETALPDQIIDVRVGINYAQTARRWGGWALAALAGGLIQRFGEGAIADGLKSLFALVGG